MVQPVANPVGPTPPPPLEPHHPTVRPGHGEPRWDDAGNPVGNWDEGTGVASDAGGDFGRLHGWAEPHVEGAGLRVRGRPQPMPRIPGRIAAAAGAVTATLVLASGQLQLGAALIAAALGMLLPRLSWIAVGIAAIAVLAGRDGDAALLAGIAIAAPIALLPREGPLWSASGVSAGLTVIGVPLIWPALAALAPTPFQRAALGAQGALVAAVCATASSTVIDAPAGDLGVLMTKLVLPLAAIWGVAAVTLPILAQGRRLGADLLGGMLWTGLLGGAMVGAKLCDPAPLLWLAPGAVVACLLLVRAALRRHAARQYDLIPE